MLKQNFTKQIVCKNATFSVVATALFIALGFVIRKRLAPWPSSHEPFQPYYEVYVRVIEFRFINQYLVLTRFSRTVAK